jgi:glycosyltransferase involved in cell wall biosynthesis
MRLVTYGVVPRVSVIMAAYNAQQYIAEALRSVEAQTYDDWEVVVCDDGSTDDTFEIASGFGERVRIVRHAKNSGLAAARNSAVRHSSGELLALLDADDYWLPSYLEHQTALFDTEGRDGQLGILACDAYVLGPDGILPRTYADLIHAPPNFTMSRLLQGNHIFVSAISPRTVVETTGGFFEELRRVEDLDLWLRIVELGYRVAVTDQPLAVYRVTHGSLSRDLSGMARAMQIVYRRALARGKLTPSERRIAQRELRLQRAVEHVVSPNGISYRRALRALPLLLRVAAEHPQRSGSFVRRAVRHNRGVLQFPA